MQRCSLTGFVGQFPTHWSGVWWVSNSKGYVCTVKIVALGIIRVYHLYQSISSHPLHILKESNQYPHFTPSPTPTTRCGISIGYYFNDADTQPNQNKPCKEIIKINTITTPCNYYYCFIYISYVLLVLNISNLK